MAGQIILSIAYGIDIAPRGDKNVETAEKAVGAIIAGSVRGRIFDLFPFRTLNSNYGLIFLYNALTLQLYICPGGSLALGLREKHD
jgi:hypothetical protein